MKNRAKSKWMMTLAAAVVALGCIPRAYPQIAGGRPAPKVDPNAIAPITRKGWEKTYSAWGAEWINRINALMPKAAERVARESECDKVETVGLSEERSRPRKSIVLFVDCANMKRFYVSDTEIEGDHTLTSQQTKAAAVDAHAALQVCEAAVKRQLAVPLSFRRKAMTTLTRIAPVTGNMVVEFQFEAKNRSGASLPQQARCVIDDRGLLEAAISSR